MLFTRFSDLVSVASYRIPRQMSTQELCRLKVSLLVAQQFDAVGGCCREKMRRDRSTRPQNVPAAKSLPRHSPLLRTELGGSKESRTEGMLLMAAAAFGCFEIVKITCRAPLRASTDESVLILHNHKKRT